MKKIGLIILSIFSLTTLAIESFSLPRVIRINGDRFSCSSPLGPAICCDPSDNECYTCYSEYTFEEQPVQNHIGMFIPSDNDPEFGEGYTDVNVRVITLSGGTKQYQFEINPENIIIAKRSEWLQYMQNRSSN